MNCYLFVKNLRIGAVYFHRNHAACARKKTQMGLSPEGGDSEGETSGFQVSGVRKKR
jgi:hypothetical protein